MKKVSNNKRSGFTLIELIAVIAIIGILATFIGPKVVGYINDARKSKVVSECRSIVMAYETITLKDVSKASKWNVNSTTIKQVMDEAKEYLEGDSLESMKANQDKHIQVCKKIVDGAQPELNSNGLWNGKFKE